MKYLITGGCGFIGSNVATSLLKDGHHVTLYDNLSRPNVYKNLMWLILHNRRVKFIQGNVEDQEKIEQMVRDLDIDVIFHFASQVGVTASILDPRFDFNSNVVGTFNVLEAARKSSKQPMVIFASTNKVYGDIEVNEPISEKQPLSFCTPYGCSKGAGEQYVLDYARIYGIPTVVLRMSCIYGTRQMGQSEQGWLCHFALNIEKPIVVYGDGNQVRDVLYIDDYVELCKLLVENKEKVAGEVYNIGGGPENIISVNEALKKFGNKIISYDEWRPHDQKFYVSNLEKIKSHLGWKPKIGIDEGFEKLLTWTKELGKENK